MNANVQAARPRGWYHGWNIVAVCILSQTVANGLTYNSFTLFLRDWSAQLHTPISSLTLCVALMALVAAVSAPVIGALADQYPARRLFVCGLLGMALFYIGVGSITATWQLLALYAVLAPISLGLSTAIIANALISRWFVRRRGLALGLSAFGIGLAGVVLPPAIAALLPTVGWRTIWRGGGVLIAVIVVPLVLLSVRNRPTDEEGRHYLSGEGASSGHHAHAVGGVNQLGWREVLARRNFWLLVGIFLPIMALNGAMVQIIAPYAANHGLSQLLGAKLLSLLSLMHVVATLLLGLLSDRFGNRLPFAGLAVVMVAGVALLIVGGADLAGIALGCVLIGLGGGVFALLAAAIAVEFGSEGVGRAFGLCMFFIPLASLAPFALAKTQEITGSYVPALIGLAILVAISGVLSLLLHERRSAPPAQAEPQPEATPL
jgi:MFS family permease